MDPLSIFIAGIVSAYVMDASDVRNVGMQAMDGPDGDFEEHYPQSASGTMESYPDDDYFHGENVSWIGVPGEMIRVDTAYVNHISGNIFYSDKLRSVVQGIGDAEDVVVFHAPFGQIGRIDISDIEEDLEYPDDITNRALTTGDSELDEYLADKDEYLDINSWDDESRQEVIDDMAERIESAVEDKDGDLGKWRATLRDGNHRAFGAILAGEPYVWMRMYGNDMQGIRSQRKKGVWISEEQKELSEILERGGI